MSMTTELVVGGVTAIAGGGLVPMLGKKEPHWRLLAIPGPSHGGYWTYQITYKVQRKVFGMWLTRHSVKSQTDRSETHRNTKNAVLTFLQAKIDGNYRDSTVAWDSRIDSSELLEELKK